MRVLHLKIKHTSISIEEAHQQNIWVNIFSRFSIGSWIYEKKKILLGMMRNNEDYVELGSIPTLVKRKMDNQTTFNQKIKQKYDIF